MTPELLKHIEDKVDENVAEVRKLSGKVSVLEANQGNMFTMLHDTQKDVKDIKTNQLVMSNELIKLTQTINGNGVKGIADTLVDTVNIVNDMAKNCLSHKDVIIRLDNFNKWFVRSILAGSASVIIALIVLIIN